jgi:hypothetical protein
MKFVTLVVGKFSAMRYAGNYTTQGILGNIL